MRRIKEYLNNGSMVIGIVLAVMGLFLTLKNDTELISFQARWFWLTFFIVVVILTLLLVVIFNQNELLKDVDEHYIERCYYENDKLFLKADYIPILQIDHVVSIVAMIDEREKTIGFGKIVNSRYNDFIEIEMIRTTQEDLWEHIKNNDKAALNKAYILPTVKVSEVRT